MNIEDLKLSAGFPIQLLVSSANAESVRYSCKLIGYLPGKGVLVTPPIVGGKVVRLVGGQKLTARLMVTNGMCLFSASVQTITASPYPILHLSYPNSVSFKGVRNATRIDVRLPIVAINESALESPDIQGVIADISVTGARLELSEDIVEIGDELVISADIKVGPIRRSLKVTAVIRSRIERSTREYDEKLPAVYGLEFIEKDDDRLLELYAYVYVEMANESLYE